MASADRLPIRVAGFESPDPLRVLSILGLTDDHHASFSLASMALSLAAVIMPPVGVSVVDRSCCAS